MKDGDKIVRDYRLKKLQEAVENLLWKQKAVEAFNAHPIKRVLNICHN